MPHVTVKHFPAALSTAQRADLVQRVSDAVSSAFGVDEGVVSISLEPVDPQEWQQRVYRPEIVGRSDLLVKIPSY